MSLEQFKTYLKTKEAKKDVVEKAREAGFEVSEEDLAKVAGGAGASAYGQNKTGGDNTGNVEQVFGDESEFGKVEISTIVRQ